jgi:hypothetical protein
MVERGDSSVPLLFVAGDGKPQHPDDATPKPSADSSSGHCTTRTDP